MMIGGVQLCCVNLEEYLKLETRLVIELMDHKSRYKSMMMQSKFKEGIIMCQAQCRAQCPYEDGSISTKKMPNLMFVLRKRC